jgi:predicted NACHT family NTPase
MIERDLVQQTREAAAAVAAGWASHSRLSDRPQIALNAVALDERGSETRNLLDMTRIHKSLLEGQRIILEGPAGCGKTTTLIQLAQISGNSQCVPLLVDLPGWITSGIDILEHISSNAAFLARGIDAATLASIAPKEPCLFLINGLNEISDLYLQNAAIRLQALVRDFPAAGVIVATRTQRFAPQLPGSTRVRLLPLTVEQRFNYLEQALGTSQAQVLHSRLSGDRALNGLTRTALFLGEITTIFRLNSGN